MNFTDYLLLKLIVLVLVVAVFGFWAGLKGKTIGQALHELRNPKDR